MNKDIASKVRVALKTEVTERSQEISQATATRDLLKALGVNLDKGSNLLPIEDRYKSVYQDR